MNDRIEGIVLSKLQPWVYNDENQAGEKLLVIDASDLYRIITDVVKKIALLNAPLSGVSSYFSFAKYVNGRYKYTDNTDKGDVYQNLVTGVSMTEQQIFDDWLDLTNR